LYYETIFIVNPDASQEKTEQLTDNLVAKVEKAGGRIVKREYWGVRQLAYSIAKRKRGHYVLLVTDGEPKAINALEDAIRLEERILRFLTARLTELSDEPSPLLRRRPESLAADREKKAPEAAEEAVPEKASKAEEAAPAEETATKTKTETKAKAKAKAKSEAKSEEPAEEETKTEDKVDVKEAAAEEESSKAKVKKAPAKKKAAKKSEEEADA
jgi:small subunit ribosomal protein S6